MAKKANTINIGAKKANGTEDIINVKKRITNWAKKANGITGAQKLC